MKKSVTNNNKLFLFTIIVGILSICFVFAAQTITFIDNTTSTTVLEDVTHLYNVTVNSTGGNWQTGNITQVNITFPSSFAFKAGSANASNLQYVFTNTSTQISFLNTSDLIKGNLTGYFWFNATASTPGTYTINVTAFNTTYSQNTSLTVTINDTTAPVITLTSPSDATSSTTNAYNFTFNVSDDSAVSSCSLIVAGSVTKTITTISNVVTNLNGIDDSPFGVTSHTWSINCTDAAGNIGNSSSRSFTVTAATTTTSSSGASQAVFSINDNQLSSGYEKTVYQNWAVKMKVSNEYHTLKVNNIDEDKIKITISSTPQTAELAIGETKTFDIDSDGVKDIEVTLNSITGSKANIIVKSISVAGDSSEDSDNAGNVDDNTPASGEESGDEEESNAKWWVIVVVLAILAVIAGAYKVKKN